MYNLNVSNPISSHGVSFQDVKSSGRIMPGTSIDKVQGPITTGAIFVELNGVQPSPLQALWFQSLARSLRRSREALAGHHSGA